MDTLFDSVAANLLTEFIVVVFGVLFANFVQRRIKQWRYGGWHLLLYPGEPLPAEETKPKADAGQRPLLERELSADTAQRILREAENLKRACSEFVSGESGRLVLATTSTMSTTPSPSRSVRVTVVSWTSSSTPSWSRSR